jgi:opacity protein-like surface antigen
MKTIIAPALLVMLIGQMFVSVALADGKQSFVGVYAGVADTALDGLGQDLDLDFMGIQLGVWVTDNFALEGRMGTGAGTDSIGSVDFEVESFGGVYGAYHWLFGDQMSVYGIAGWSEASIKASAGSDSVRDDEKGFSYGAGIKLSIVNIEYLRLLDTSDVEVDALSVGLQYTFD